MPPQLTTGVLAKLMDGEQVQDPILQILQHKEIPSQAHKGRHRLLLSDGQYQISHAMIVGVPNIENFSVLKLKKWTLNEQQNKGASSNKATQVLILLEVEMLATLESKIGDPVNLSEAKEAQSKPVESFYEAKKESVNLNDSVSSNRVISSISSLTPYHNKWVIKARVMSKSPMRSWSNSRGEGKLFSFDLMDESGEIRCTAFRDLAEKYYNFLEEDKVYYISKCMLKTANKQFNTLKNEYEMTLGNESVIEECHDGAGAVPQINYNFTQISDIQTSKVNDVIDVIGVCRDSSDVQELVSRTTNRELKKREVTLVDQSQACITLTLWGKDAENFDGSNHPVVALRTVKITEFGGGKNLSTTMSTVMKVNPDIAECHQLKGWYDNEGQRMETKNLSERSGRGGGDAQWVCLKEVHDRGLGQSERGDYFETIAHVLLVRSENALYKACPTDDCNKKVVDLENGMYRCEKCDREFPNFKYRLLLQMNIADFTANQWVSMFSSEAEKILGKTAQEIGLAMENDASTATAIFQAAHFKQFLFRCRAKMETFNDEQRLKIVVVHVDPVDYVKHGSNLLKQTKDLMSDDV